MLKYTVLFLILSVFTVFAFPVTDNKVDKSAAQNEVSVNLEAERGVTETEKKTKVQPQVSVSVGGNVEVSVPSENKTARVPLFPPEPPSTKNENVFSRFLSDIFQIPITVLQSVSKLLTNPFTQLNKEKETATY